MKLILVGAKGRMGQEIKKILENKQELEPFIDTESLTESLIEVDALSSGYKAITEVKESAQICIDFSLPEATPAIVDYCTRNKVALLSGVTGLSDQQKTLLNHAAATIPVLWSPNMSLGIALVHQLIQHFSQVSFFDFVIEDLHHRHKKDKPSGTALLLQQSLESAINKPVLRVDSRREGEHPGCHRIIASSLGERIVIEHEAKNRVLFAQGAVLAAFWLLNQAPGLYSIQNVLDFKS